MRLLAGLTLLTLTACTAGAPDQGRTLYVEPAPDGEWDDPSAERRDVFTTIQAAIDASSGGEDILVPSGTYLEDLLIDATKADDLRILGAGPGETFLVGYVTITDRTAALDGMTLLDPVWFATDVAQSDHGILISGATVDLGEVEAHYFEHAVHAEADSAVTVTRSHLSRNWYGLVADDSKVTVANSLVTSNGAGGVAFSNDSYGSIRHNTFLGNAYQANLSYLTGAISVGPAANGTSVKNNVAVSNFYGIDCNGCNATFGRNLVWANTTDYINDASQQSDDLPVDPQFVSITEGDYHLAAGSPCIDAGAASGVEEDFEGETRPQGAGPDIGMDEFTSSALSLLITEVMANPITESTGEFVEIYNAGAAAVDLADLIIDDGDDADELIGYDDGTHAVITSVASGAYALIIDPGFNGDFPLNQNLARLTTSDSTIGNGLTTSDRLALLEEDGTTRIATFSFAKDPGNGRSLEMVDVDSGDTSGNWRPSACPNESSPGEDHCFPESGDPADLVITEVMANPKVESSGEYVEIYNPTDREIDAGGLKLTDGDAEDTLEGYQGGSTLVPAMSHALILDSGYAYDYFLPTGIVLLTAGDTLGNRLSTNDPVTLYKADGTTVIDTWANPFDPGDGKSAEKIDYTAADSTGNWQSGAIACSRGKSPGRLNGAALGACGTLHINEVMSNALDEDTGEFVEIYNPGPDTVDLAGLKLFDGSSLDTLGAFQAGSTTLGPDSFALVVDAEYAGEYALPGGTLLVTTTDTTLGNSLAVGDPITLLEADGTHQIDAYLFPINAGNGTSVERVNLLSAIDFPENWVPSPCASGSSPGSENCVSSGSSGIELSDLEIVITEIMANPLDETTGEFVEIYNYGSSAIDLFNFVIYDGDALDTIFGYTSLYDTILDPGDYAVILDADYALEYTIPGTALLLTTDDGAIASGLATSDPIFLLEPDASTLLDSYT
ncbi:MAG: lamin tail domain-containing protein, partial [Deltaproteobacteria bacterium]|nr:lamin tail domain-containing protein [Deltaproteobacteria bacterium]